MYWTRIRYFSSGDTQYRKPQTESAMADSFAPGDGGELGNNLSHPQ